MTIRKFSGNPRRNSGGISLNSMLQENERKARERGWGYTSAKEETKLSSESLRELNACREKARKKLFSTEQIKPGKKIQNFVKEFKRKHPEIKKQNNFALLREVIKSLASKLKLNKLNDLNAFKNYYSLTAEEILEKGSIDYFEGKHERFDIRGCHQFGLVLVSVLRELGFESYYTRSSVGHTYVLTILPKAIQGKFDDYIIIDFGGKRGNERIDIDSLINPKSFNPKNPYTNLKNPYTLIFINNLKNKKIEFALSPKYDLGINSPETAFKQKKN